MPYEEHSEFIAPTDPEMPIWRYMDLAQFLSVLDQSALYFPRLDKLAEKDPFEGSFTNLDYISDKLTYSDLKPQLPPEMTEERFNAYWQFNRKQREFVKKNREWTFVNCWHCQKHESAAMWSLYGKTQEGIAIQSTFTRLKEALKVYPEFGIYIGMVSYLDYDTESISQGNIMRPFIAKRRSFEHEHELRAVLWTPQHGKNPIFEDPSRNRFANNAGINVPVDLNTLVNRIYVAPTAPDWMLKLIPATVKRFGFGMEVVQSNLAARPLRRTNYRGCRKWWDDLPCHPCSYRPLRL